MYLHRIPGLSRRFIYFNDDFFLGRPVTPQDFFSRRGNHKLLFHATSLPSDHAHGSTRDRACAHTQSVLDRLWGPPPAPRLLPAHAPQAYDRERLAWLESLLPQEFRSTAGHRLREDDDLVLSALYTHSLLQAAHEQNQHQVQVLPDYSSDYYLLKLEHKPAWVASRLAAIWRLRPRFFCLNDDLGSGLFRRPILLGTTGLLRLLYPHASAWEK